VEISGFAFNPETITVAAGTTVTWTNLDSVAHTVTADSGGAPDSGDIAQGESYSFTFTAPGTFAYHCSVHRFMHGTVIVTP
jgi:plastocyanin